MKRERGSTTVVMIAVVAIGFALLVGAARLGTAVVARARADTAADAAALAAADMIALDRGADAAEAAAGETVVVEYAVGALGASARSTARAEARDPIS